MFVLIQSYQSTSFRRRIERNSELTRLPKIGKDLVSLSRRNPPSSQCKSSRSQNDHYHHSRHLPSPILKCVLSGSCVGQLREHTSATWVVTWLVEMHASLFRQHRHDERCSSGHRQCKILHWESHAIRPLEGKRTCLQPNSVSD